MKRFEPVSTIFVQEKGEERFHNKYFKPMSMIKFPKKSCATSEHCGACFEISTSRAVDTFVKHRNLSLASVVIATRIGAHVAGGSDVTVATSPPTQYFATMKNLCSSCVRILFWFKSEVKLFN